MVDTVSANGSMAAQQRSSAWPERRAAFLRVFNWFSVALTFYITLVIVMTWWLPAVATQGFYSWLEFLAYIMRQNLYSALMTLFALAAADAWLPLRWPPRWRALAVLALLAVAVSISAAARLSTGRGQMTTAEISSWFVSVLVMWTLIGMLGYALLCAARKELETRRRIQEARCSHDTLVAQALEARLTALQAQIEPHFLFNTLASVKRLYETDRERARQMLGSLIDYLRAALPSMRQSGSTLARELELARSYLTILKMRMGERLLFAIDTDGAPADAALPPLVLATLVENAVKHGLSALPEGGSIHIRASQQGSDLVLEVADNGRGFNAAGGSGVGLANTRSRLAALYGERAGLSLRSNSPHGVIAEVRVPLMVPLNMPLTAAAV